MNAAHEDPEVRAAVLASITPAEARWLAQNSAPVLSHCADEMMMTMMGGRNADTLAAWREAQGIDPPETRASWRLPDGDYYVPPSVSRGTDPGDNAVRGAL